MILHSLQSWTLLQLHIIVQLQSALLQEQPSSKWYVSRNLTTISKDAVMLVVFCPSFVEINILRLRLLILRQMNDRREKNDENNNKVRKKTEKILTLRFYSSLVRWMHAGRGRSWNQLTPHLLHSGPLFFLDIFGSKNENLRWQFWEEYLTKNKEW